MSLRPRAAAAPEGAPARPGTLHGPAITLAPRAAPVGAPLWFGKEELDRSEQVRKDHGKDMEFRWQVRNELSKYARGDRSVSLVVIVKRLLDYWHQEEKYDPTMLIGLLVGTAMGLVQYPEWKVDDAIVKEATKAAGWWIDNVVNSMTAEDRVAYFQSVALNPTATSG